MGVLKEDKIRSLLAHLEGWSYDGEKIVKEVKFPTFLDVINSVTRIAEIAEAKNHHPDMDIRYNVLKLNLVTHDKGGVTENDMAMARLIDKEIKKESFLILLLIMLS